jgi:hypothetical protein
VQSLPEFSHDLHVVPTPLLTHLTLERRQRMQAMLERIRPCACLGEGPAALKVVCPGEAMVVLIAMGLGDSGRLGRRSAPRDRSGSTLGDLLTEW